MEVRKIANPERGHTTGLHLLRIAILPIVILPLACSTTSFQIADSSNSMRAQSTSSTGNTGCNSTLMCMSFAGSQGHKYFGKTLPTVFVNTGAERSEINFSEEPIVVEKEGEHVGTEYDVRIGPKLLVVGDSYVDIELELNRPGVRRDFGFDSVADSFALKAQGSGVDMPLHNFRVEHGNLVATITEVTPDLVGYKQLVLYVGGKESTITYALRVISKYRLLLTFDDGPSVERFSYLGKNKDNKNNTPTEKVLDILKANDIKAAFFLVTTSDRFLWVTHPKAETTDGFNLIKREIQEGHVLACHWGGDYISQSVLHPNRVPGNVLSNELTQCKDRIRDAYIAVGEAYYPEFVRPPLWVYKSGSLDARPTYQALGLKMILTDAKLGDGGYPMAGGTYQSWVRAGIRKCIDNSEADIVITMHDSNQHTARDLEGELADIKDYMYELGLLGKYKFVDATSEVKDILRNKARFLNSVEYR